MAEQTPQEKGMDIGFVARVVGKAALLFAALNVLWALIQPLPALGGISIYNSIVPGRPRLPFGEAPEEAYNFSTFQLDAMFASHAIEQPKAADEFRVVLIGDSSVWGFLLTPEESLTGQLNAMGLETPEGQQVRVYNVGYPTITLTKDLLMLSRAMDYEPDLIVWLTTLEAMPVSKQLSSPILQNNPGAVRALIDELGVESVSADDEAFVEQTFFDRTIIGQRREIADVVRLNLYGVMWAATGIDQVYPEDYEPRAEDFEADASFYNIEEPLTEADLALDVLAAGMALAGDVPVLVINEPMFVSDGANSDIRYNFFYPRWAYDAYRQIMAAQADANGWRYADMWQVVDNGEYTNSAIHLTPAGERQLTAAVRSEIEAFLTDR